MKTAYFMDFEFETEGSVFFPRPETELLVEKAVEVLAGAKSKDSGCDVLDVGTGSGNIAISLTKYIPSSRIVALDISDTALRVASQNAARYGLGKRIAFVRSNLFDAIAGRYSKYFDLIISNPPYVSLEDFSALSGEVKQDPYVALYGGEDGLGFYRRIAKEAGGYLKPDGIILLEVGYGQSRKVKTILEETGVFTETEIYKDHAGIERIIKSTLLRVDAERSRSTKKWKS